MKLQLIPYLNFEGNCAEAMEFYHGVLGGELHVSTFGDSPVESKPEDKDRVMHATLQSDTFSLMASDAMPNGKVDFGNSVHLSIMGDDEPKLTELFDKLSVGGNVDMPLAKQFWGDTFGMFTDKYGMHWMFNISATKS